MDPKDTLISAKQTRSRYGGRSDMWLWRLLHDETSGFPEPLVINGRRYWRIRELEKWERSLASKKQVA